jgi:peptidoglycan/LPS O-acetylase OafA/YrhL
MTRPLLISLYVAWPLVVVVARATARVRLRFILVSAAGWLGALVIATTAQPVDTAIAAGLPTAIAVSLCFWLFTSSGFTFTWEQDKTYGEDNSPIPIGEKIAGALVALIGLLAILVSTLT